MRFTPNKVGQMTKEIGYLSGDTFRFLFFNTQKNTLHISVNQLSIVPNSNIFTGNKSKFSKSVYHCVICREGDKYGKHLSQTKSHGKSTLK